MNTLKIIHKISSRYYLKEIFLVLMLASIVVFSNVVLEPFETYDTTREEIHQSLTLDFDNTLHFNPNITLAWSDILNEDAIHYPEVHESLEQVPGTAAVLKNCQNTASYELDDHTCNINFVMYSEAFYEYIGAELWTRYQDTDVDTGSAVPVLVSATASSVLPVGTKQHFSVPFEDLEFDGVVVGVIDWECAIPVANSYNNWGNLTTLGISEREYSGYDFMVAVYNPEKMTAVNWDYAAYVVPEAGVDFAKWSTDINQAVEKWGSCRPLTEIEADAFEYLLENHLQEQLYFFLVLLVALFGFGGYLFLSVQERKQQYAIFYILGMPRVDMLVYNLLQTTGICVVAVIVGWAASPWAAKKLFQMEQYKSAGWLGTWCSALLLFITIISSLVSSFAQYRNASTISLYKGGD